MASDRPPSETNTDSAETLPFRLGCAVWGYSGWRGSWLPADIPPKLMLPAYAQCFTAVEGNTTFYG
ncbi:MAG: hypothetical protein AAGF75_10530, partial [Cyanobacteria bacterium P01_H01_bin.130]